MAVERVHLIRHGQTAWNAEGRWQGFEATSLNQEGCAQARALAAAWKRPLSAIYSSDLPRAFETAAALGEALGMMPVIDERLRETHLGIFQGKTSAEIRLSHPVEFETMQSLEMDFCVPSGESKRQTQARCYHVFCEILDKESGPEVAIVSHGGTLKYLLYKLFGQTDELVRSYLPNTSVTTIERRGDDWHLVELAATPHLVTLAPADGTTL